jgi:Hydantoinase/oxoprolinase
MTVKAVVTRPPGHGNLVLARTLEPRTDSGEAGTWSASSRRRTLWGMGGTSYDVSIVSEGRIRLVTQGTVDGLPVRLPMIEIRTIGCVSSEG